MEKVERKAWTPEEDAVIRAGREKNLQYEEIAAQLPGRTRSAVSVRAHQLRGIDKSANGSAPVAAAPAPATQGQLPHVENAPKKRGRPPKVRTEAAPAEAPAVAAQAPVAAEEAPKKKRGRPPKNPAAEAPVAVAQAPAQPVAPAAKPRTPRAPKAAPAPVAAHANGHANGNGAVHVANGNGASALMLGQGSQLKVHGASMELVPGGGLRFNFGDGRYAEVAAPAA